MCIIYTCSSCLQTLTERCRDAEHLKLQTCGNIITMDEATRCNACTNVEGAISRLSLLMLVSQVSMAPWEWRLKKVEIVATPSPGHAEYIEGGGT